MSRRRKSDATIRRRIRSKTVMVLNKLEPCNCGCHGTDPWHRVMYHRIVTQTDDLTGTVRMPYSTLPVKVTRDLLGLRSNGDPLYGAWVVDRGSIVFDK